MLYQWKTDAGDNRSFQNAVFHRLDILLSTSSQTRKPADWTEDKRYTQYVIWAVIGGEIDLTYKNKRYRLNGGDLFFFFPGERFVAKAASDGVHFYYTHFLVHTETGGNTALLSDLAIDGRMQQADCAREVQLFMEQADARASDLPFCYMGAKGAVMLLLTAIVRHYAAAGKILDDTQPADIVQQARYIRLTEFIEAHLFEKITIKDLAALVHMSEKYVIKYFHKRIGISPYAYIRQRRMEYAANALLSGTHTIKELADQLGYSDQFAFSRAFKKYFGTPPSKIL